MSVPSFDEIRRARFVVVVVIRSIAALLGFYALVGFVGWFLVWFLSHPIPDVSVPFFGVVPSIVLAVLAFPLWMASESIAVRVVPTSPIRTSTDPIGERGGANDGAGEGG